MSETKKLSNNPNGRPSKYNEEMQQKADDYVDNYPEYIQNPDGKTVVNTIPTVAELALKLRIHRATMYEWASKNRQFCDTLEQIKLMQEHMITKYGLNKTYDSAFAKFIAVNVSSYKDKVEHTVDQKTIQINIEKVDSEL